MARVILNDLKDDRYYDETQFALLFYPYNAKAILILPGIKIIQPAFIINVLKTIDKINWFDSLDVHSQAA